MAVSLSPKDDPNLNREDHDATSRTESLLPAPRDSSNNATNTTSSSEAPTLPLLQGRTTLAEALEEEENMLFRLAYPSQRVDFFVWILQHRKDFEAIISYHLCLADGETCRFGEVKEWTHGSFNACIPIHIDNWSKYPRKKVLLRIPLPYKVGESTYPGNEDEKLRTEAATFIWIQDNCPDVPIPHLWGFGFPGGQSFMRPENAPFSTRIVWYLQRAISSLFRSILPCRFISYNRQNILEHGYLIMDYIETTDAQMLSESWIKLYESQDLRTNLFRDLSRIILSLSQLPLPCIGSWTIDKQGVLMLTNRPLIHQFHSLENEGISTNIPRTQTYTCADAYYIDLLACHDSRIRSQPNSIFNEKDGFAQMANLFTMRGLLSHFTSRDLRNGPFVFNLTDLHGSNLFVDTNWHIKYIIDLEWACSLPIEMVTPPYWITNRAVDQLYGDELERFENAYQEFTDIFEEEEKSFTPTYGSTTYRTDIMKKGWKIGNFWYFEALQSPKGLFNLFRRNMQPIFDPQRDNIDGFVEIVSHYWASNTREVVVAKLEDKKKYKHNLQELFEKYQGCQ